MHCIFIFISCYLLQKNRNAISWLKSCFWNWNFTEFSSRQMSRKMASKLVNFMSHKVLHWSKCRRNLEHFRDYEKLWAMAHFIYDSSFSDKMFRAKKAFSIDHLCFSKVSFDVSLPLFTKKTFGDYLAPSSFESLPKPIGNLRKWCKEQKGKKFERHTACQTFFLALQTLMCSNYEKNLA